MKREIKFRAWDFENQKMIYPSICHNEQYVMQLNCEYIGEFNGKKYNTVKLILQQFTGREDAQINGTEVYEGDIIENCDTKALQIVYWNEDEAAWYCKYVDDDNGRIVSLAESLGNLNKVIGNIYEHEI